MTDLPLDPPPDEQPSTIPLNPADALDHIVDDSDAREVAASWAIDQLTNGRTFEDVQEELTAIGWSAEDAEFFVENARRETRGLRGIVTRDEVAHQANTRYRKVMSLRWIVGFPLLTFAWRLLMSLAYLFQSKSRRNAPSSTTPRNDPASTPHTPPPAPPDASL